jgi:hypothetical protein
MRKDNSSKQVRAIEVIFIVISNSDGHYSSTVMVLKHCDTAFGCSH